MGDSKNIIEKIRILGENSRYDLCASTASSRNTYSLRIDGASGNSRNNVGVKQSIGAVGKNFSSLRTSIFNSEYHIESPLALSNGFGSDALGGVCHSYTPDGRCVSLFKVLLSNKCKFNCNYCFTRGLSPDKRVSLTPEEYAETFIKLYSMNAVEGVFISSAICGDADETTKKMLKVVKILREKYRFMGYIHFKCLPGTSYYLIKEAMKYADRISINLEAPTKSYLSEIAEQKSFDNDLLQRQKWIKELRARWNEYAIRKLRDYYEDKGVPIDGSVRNLLKLYNISRLKASNGYKKINWDNLPILNSGQTTQFVVGAADERDFDILKRTDYEYRELNARRVYYSAFIPIEGSPLQHKAATPPERENRLYRADWLLRRYKIQFRMIKEILDDEGNLPAGDPKVHIALNYFRDKGPIDPNTASYDDLLMVPGIGHISARRIIDLRRNGIPITSRTTLKSLGVVIAWAEPFLRINGYTQTNLLKYLNANDRRFVYDFVLNNFHYEFKKSPAFIGRKHSPLNPIRSNPG